MQAVGLNILSTKIFIDYKRCLVWSAMLYLRECKSDEANVLHSNVPISNAIYAIINIMHTGYFWHWTWYQQRSAVQVLHFKLQVNLCACKEMPANFNSSSYLLKV